MNNENDESNLQTFTDDSFVVKNISKEFYDRYGDQIELENDFIH